MMEVIDYLIHYEKIACRVFAVMITGGGVGDGGVGAEGRCCCAQ